MASGSPDAYFDYQVLVGHLARRIGRMQLAVGVTEPVRRHPVLLAQAFLTLAHLTKRAPILGIGPGERENTEPYGFDFSRPVSVLEEALQVIRLCFESDGPIDFSGEHFRLDGALMDLSAPPGRTPEIWLAAHGPRMLRMTGRYGDGWYPALPMTVDEYAGKLAVIRRAAREAGRNPAAIVPGYQAVFVVGRTDVAARRLLEAKPIRLLALLAPDELWRRHGSGHPLGEGFRGLVDFVPSRYSRAELEAAMAAVPIDVLSDAVLWGTPQRIETALGEFMEAGMRHVVLVPASGLVSRRDAVFAVRALARLARRLRR
jgi:phthiodiolone/phenolphthiodiolone dimycocerosates ketoreductase